MRAHLAVAVLVAVLIPAVSAQESPDKLLLKDYRPKSIYKIPVTEVSRAKFPVIDMHSHPYAKTPEQVDQWVRTMDEVGIEKTILLTGASGAAFDAVRELYSGHPGRFELWCGFALAGFDKPGGVAAAVKELDRCHRLGARGVGELVDKGRSGGFGREARVAGMHPDDPRLDPLFARCAELNMPVNIHVADPYWMYLPMDHTNDGLMNALRWRLDNQKDIVDHSGMIEILERTVKRHPRTTFVACHFANLCYDLSRLGVLLDTCPNLYADISARYAETATIPRFVSAFYEKYQDRLLYGTDMGFHPRMYRITFRILETLDEHFYETEQFNYHWSLHGFGLPESVLRKVYRANALKLIPAGR